MNFYKNLSLKARWMILISFAITLAVGITVLFSQLTIRNLLEDSNHETSTAIANNAEDQFSLSLLNHETSILQFGQVIEIILQKDLVDYSQIDQIINTYLTTNEDYTAVYFMDFETGKLHISPSISSDFDVRGSETFKTLTANPSLKWMDIYLDKTSNTLMTSLIAPVFKGNQLIGAVGYDLDFSAINSVREEIESSSGAKLLITDPNGLIVSSFIEGAEGQNINADSSGKISGVTDLLEPAELEEKFGWIFDNNSDQSFEWDGINYDSEMNVMEKNNWNIVSLVDTNNYMEKIKDFTLIGWLSVSIGIIIGILFSYLMVKQLINILSYFKVVFEKTASGDFASRFESDYNDEITEIASHYNKMLDEVCKLITQVQDNTEAIQQSSNSLAIIAKENEQALTNASNSLTGITTSTNEQIEKMLEGTNVIGSLAGGIAEINKQSQQMVSEADEALVEVHSSIEKVRNLEVAYHKLETTFQQVTAVTSNLDEKTKSISQVTNAIAQITEQTNLLALNASIEAARAGEHGKGFAVVANEVRSLAESSKAATINIQQIILTILDDTEKLVQVIKETNEMSMDQKNAVNSVDSAIHQLSKTLEQMKKSISHTMDNVTLVENQKNMVIATVSQVNEKTALVQEETQEIASSIEEQTSSTSEVTSHTQNLNNQVTTLIDSVSKFRL